MSTKRKAESCEDEGKGGDVGRGTKYAKEETETNTAATQKPIEGWHFSTEDWAILCKRSEALKLKYEWFLEGRGKEKDLAAHAQPGFGFFLRPEDIPMDFPEEPVERARVLDLARRTLGWILAMECHPKVRVCHLAETTEEFVRSLWLLIALATEDRLVEAAIYQGYTHMEHPIDWSLSCDRDLLRFLILDTDVHPKVISTIFDSKFCIGLKKRSSSCLTQGCEITFEVPSRRCVETSNNGVFDENRILKIVSTVCILDRTLVLDMANERYHLWSYEGAAKLRDEYVNRYYKTDEILEIDLRPREEFATRMQKQPAVVLETLEFLDRRLGVPWKGVICAGGFPFDLLVKRKNSSDVNKWRDIDFFLCGSEAEQLSALGVLLEVFESKEWTYLRNDERELTDLSRPVRTLTFQHVTGVYTQIVLKDPYDITAFEVLESFDFTHVSLSLVGSSKPVFHSRILNLIHTQKEVCACVSISKSPYVARCDLRGLCAAYRTAKAEARGIKVNHGFFNCPIFRALTAIRDANLEEALLPHVPRATACSREWFEIDKKQFLKNFCHCESAFYDSATDRDEKKVVEKEGEYATRHSTKDDDATDEETEDGHLGPFRDYPGTGRIWLHSSALRPLSLEKVFRALVKNTYLEGDIVSYTLYYPNAVAYLSESPQDGDEGEAIYYAHLPNHGASDRFSAKKRDEQSVTGVRLSVVNTRLSRSTSDSDSIWPVRARLSLMVIAKLRTYWTKNELPVTSSEFWQVENRKAIFQIKVNNHRLPRLKALKTYDLSELDPF